EGVADPGAHRDAARLGDDLGHGARGYQVVDDGRARLAGQFPGGDQRGDHRRRDRLAALVHHEAAVGVAVEGQPDVRSVLGHRALEVAQVLRVDGVGVVVRERAVELEVERDQRDRETLEDLRHGVARHPVARVHDDLERPDRGDVDELPQVIGVPGEQVPRGDRAGYRGWNETPFGIIFYLLQAGLDADRPSPGPAQLDAVVAGRVVAGRDHRAGRAEVAAGVVKLIGRAQAAGQHVGPLR